MAAVARVGRYLARVRSIHRTVGDSGTRRITRRSSFGRMGVGTGVVGSYTHSVDERWWIDVAVALWSLDHQVTSTAIPVSAGTVDNLGINQPLIKST